MTDYEELLSPLAAAELALLELEDQQKICAEFRARFEVARERLKGKCPHPQDRRRPFEWEHDDGYGRQSMHTGQRCLLCGALDHYNHWLDSKI